MTIATRVTPAAPTRTDELLDLMVERLPHLNRAEASWPFVAPRMYEGLVVLHALDADDRVVGVGLTGRINYAPEGSGFLRVVVRRGEEGRGIGRALRASLLDKVLPGIDVLRGAVYDDEPRALEVTRHWGFGIEEHSIESGLSLTGPDPPEPAPPAGVTLEEAPGLDFPDREAVERMLVASQTNPEAEVGFVFTLQKLADLVTPDEVPLCVVARDAGRPVGITFGAVSDGRLSIVYSGIDPGHRGRGLMLLVKQRAHLAAVRAGATESVTHNEEHNHGIRRVNAALGYTVRSGTYRLKQDVHSR